MGGARGRAYVTRDRILHAVRKGISVLVAEKVRYLRKQGLSRNFDSAPFFIGMMSVHISSGLVLHQMTSDHNSSELGIHDHSNELSRSKLVPKVVPLAVKTATSRQELELLFHLQIAMLRTTGAKTVVRLGINPMIQPEPEDLPKDNPNLEIAVLRQKPGQYIIYQNHKMIAGIENDIMDPVMLANPSKHIRWQSAQPRCHKLLFIGSFAIALLLFSRTFRVILFPVFSMTNGNPSCVIIIQHLRVGGLRDSI
ncbi:hypothetical protein Tco_0560932 [Tanacetum coccineum]